MYFFALLYTLHRNFLFHSMTALAAEQFSQQQEHAGDQEADAKKTAAERRVEIKADRLAAQLDHHGGHGRHDQQPQQL